MSAKLTQRNRFVRNRFVQKSAMFLVRKIANAFSLDLLKLGYNDIGVLNFKNEFDSGEYYMVSHWLKQFLAIYKIDEPCFFDVGANIGNYCKILSSVFPYSKIYAFEPNPETYKQLRFAFLGDLNICTNNIGLGSVSGNVEFYHRKDDPSSEHATIYKDVLTRIYSDIQKIIVPIDTLDGFCSKNDIKRIDFLKIDVEGHELAVLQGAKNLLDQGRVSSIQFEFNEMNIYSRVFLRDFFDILRDFNIYRLLPKALLPIQYGSENEIFLFQNFLAVRKALDFFRN